MTKYFGNATTITIDGDAKAQVETMTLPEQNFETVDFTALGDTFEDLKISPVQSASPFTLSLYFDRSDSDQSTLDALIGVDTAVAAVYSFPWASNNTATINVKVTGAGPVEIVSRDALRREYSFIPTSAITWSTV